jgi:4-hydroxy-2-oxovalerate aldolase
LIEILDTTLRDGSYVIDFQFDADDTAVLVRELNLAGVPYIEIGHGLGLGASQRPEMKAAVNDQEYLSAAAHVAADSRWGAFFIPGIGEIDDIYQAAQFGMSFIRIGTDITDVSRSEEYVSTARSLGLEVFCNLMKTYAVEPRITAEMAKVAVAMGANHVCVVDSAGGMLPTEVAAHVKAIKDRTEISVGFHGHNNLGLAIANGLAAVEAGAAIIDTSLRGMGRSAGNASTEIFALALRRAGFETQLDVNHLLDTAEHVIDPLLQAHQQMDSVGVISGYARFHSSFTDKVGQVAERYGVDIRDLIVELTKVNRLSAPDDLLDTLAAKLSKLPQKARRPIEPKVLRRSSDDSYRQQNSLSEVLSRCHSVARKWDKTSTLNIVCSEFYGLGASDIPLKVSDHIFEGRQFVVASLVVTSEEQFREVVAHSKKFVELILVDQDRLDQSLVESLILSRNSRESPRVLLYSDVELWSRAAVRMARALSEADRYSTVVVVGDSQLAQLTLNHLQIYMTNVESYPSAAELQVGHSKLVLLCSAPDELFLRSLNKCTLLDVRLNSLTAEEVEDLSTRRNQVLRLEMQRELQAEIQAQLESADRYLDGPASRVISGVRTVSNGLVGQAGDVVLDSVQNPMKIIGVADGCGLLKPLEAYDTDDFDRVHRIREWIFAQRHPS